MVKVQTTSDLREWDMIQAIKLEAHLSTYTAQYQFFSCPNFRCRNPTTVNLSAIQQHSHIRRVAQACMWLLVVYDVALHPGSPFVLALQAHHSIVLEKLTRNSRARLERFHNPTPHAECHSSGFRAVLKTHRRAPRRSQSFSTSQITLTEPRQPTSN